jgi:SAM-dependent methyltransferase
MYGKEYFTECSETCGAHGAAAYMEMAQEGGAARARAARRLSDRFLRHEAARGDLLEIGCGPGFLLAELRDLGWNVTGVELSDYAVHHARETLHLDVRLGSIDSLDLGESSFDAVFMGDVLEHLPRPVEVLERVHRLLRPGGVLLVAIPSTMNLLSAKLGMQMYRSRGKFKTLRIPPYHLYEYTPRTIRSLLERCAFHVAEVDQSTVPLGRMGLRGSGVENAGTSRLCNRGGDRLLAAALTSRRP